MKILYESHKVTGRLPRKEVRMGKRIIWSSCYSTEKYE